MFQLLFNSLGNDTPQLDKLPDDENLAEYGMCSIRMLLLRMFKHGASMEIDFILQAWIHLIKSCRKSFLLSQMPEKSSIVSGFCSEYNFKYRQQAVLNPVAGPDNPLCRIRFGVWEAHVSQEERYLADTEYLIPKVETARPPSTDDNVETALNAVSPSADDNVETALNTVSPSADDNGQTALNAVSPSADDNGQTALNAVSPSADGRGMTADGKIPPSPDAGVSSVAETVAPLSGVITPSALVGDFRQGVSTMTIGQVLDGRYRIQRKLGAGGTSSVYLAEHLSLGNLWAVKVLSGADDAPDTHRKEAEILMRLNHPMLPRIADILTQSGNLCIVMDYVQGHNLADRLQESGAIPEMEVRGWMLQLCDVLSYLHGQKPEPIIYRDLKPANLMADAHGHLKLVDFGTARAYRKGSGEDTTYIGTQGYASPEQYGLNQSDARTDLYNMGMTMFHLLTGVHPISIPHGDLDKLLREHGLSEAITDIIRKCVQLSPANRYQDAASCRVDLLRLPDPLESKAEVEVAGNGQSMDRRRGNRQGNIGQTELGKRDIARRDDGFQNEGHDDAAHKVPHSGERRGFFSRSDGTEDAERPLVKRSRMPRRASDYLPGGREQALRVPVQSRLAILGACPGAGATFAAIAVASFLVLKKRSASIAELNTSNDFNHLRAHLEGTGHSVRYPDDNPQSEAFSFHQVTYHPSCRRLTDIRGHRAEVMLLDLGSVRTPAVMEEFLRADARLVYCPQADWKLHHLETLFSELDPLEASAPIIYLLPQEERADSSITQRLFGQRQSFSFPRVHNPFTPNLAECRQMERMFRLLETGNR